MFLTERYFDFKVAMNFEVDDTTRQTHLKVLQLTAPHKGLRIGIEMKTILGTMTFSDQVDQSTAVQMVSAFYQTGGVELDTAYVYNIGNTEILLGKLNEEGNLAGLLIAGKANPWVDGGLSAMSVKHQLTTSLARLKTSSLDLFYLHAPDLNVPIFETLQAVSQLYAEGKFKHFGLSNYAAWQVAEVVEICQREGWPLPSVYQGMYNALTRDVERELFACLKNYKIAFYVYNPLAGGMLSGKHQDIDSIPTNGRFASFDGYQERYWTPSYFNVINEVTAICHSNAIAPSDAAIRWLVHHSALASSWAEHGVILGASSFAHLEQNIAAMHSAELPSVVVDAFDEAWETVRPGCIKYFRP